MRPGFHFTAPTGWINDPHGITWHDGRYHAFYQFVPDSTVWAPACRWGHATGPDLLSLTAGPVALEPGDGDDGIWTGSLVLDDAGAATILYTSVRTEDLDGGRVRVARPLDEEWVAWEKGPIVLEPPAELDLFAFRDPFVTRDAEGWRMLVGAGTRDGTALAIGYRSVDLARWDAIGIVSSRPTIETDGAWTGALWECPQLVDIDGTAVLITSIWAGGDLHGVGYGIGRMVGDRFEADTWGRLSHGPSYYAPSFYRDSGGRPSLLFWMRGVRDDAEGWNGAHSIPYLLSVVGDQLVVSPHPDIDRYLGPARSGDSGAELPPAAELRWDPNPGGELRVLAGDVEVLTVTASVDGVRLSAAAGAWSMPWSGGELRILVDGPLVELVSADGVLGGPIAAPGGPLTLGSTGPAPVVRALRRV